MSMLGSGNERGWRNSKSPLCVGFSEIDKYAIQIYEKHFKGHKNYGDCTRIDWTTVPDFDLLVGGFPCPSFSIAGKRLSLDDPRGKLFFEIIRCLKSKQPRFALLENVKGILSASKGKVMEKVVESLSNLGYYINYDNYNSKNYGVPQNRERIFFICTHLKEIVGQYQKMNTLKKYIEQFLFQILLKNLTEAKKLQEAESKDSILSCLILKEISQNQNLFAESTKAIISTSLEESKYPLVRVNLWRNIESLLQNEWEENYLGQNKYTILTVINEIMNWETFSYSRMLLSILTLTVYLRNSSRNLWEETLSNLILIKEGTKYARINKKAEKYTLSESNSLYITKHLGDFSRYFIVGHLRGTSGGQVFPLGQSSEEDYETQVLGTLKAGYYKMGYDNPVVADFRNDEGLKVRKDNITPCLARSKHSETDPSQISPLVLDLYNNKAHSDRTPTLTEPHHNNIRVSITSHSPRCGNPKKGGTGVLESDEHCFTLDRSPHIVNKIRRLTPVECERLQGFPDGWTEGVSDTQRYKTLGNAVTVNVIEAIMERMINVI